MSRTAFGRPRGAPSDRGHTSRGLSHSQLSPSQLMPTPIGGRPGAYGGGGGARPAFHQRNDAPPDTVLGNYQPSHPIPFHSPLIQLPPRTRLFSSCRRGRNALPHHLAGKSALLQRTHLPTEQDPNW